MCTQWVSQLRVWLAGIGATGLLLWPGVWVHGHLASLEVCLPEAACRSVSQASYVGSWLLSWPGVLSPGGGNKAVSQAHDMIAWLLSWPGGVSAGCCPWVICIPVMQVQGCSAVLGLCWLGWQSGCSSGLRCGHKAAQLAWGHFCYGPVVLFLRSEAGARLFNWLRGVHTAGSLQDCLTRLGCVHQG